MDSNRLIAILLIALLGIGCLLILLHFLLLLWRRHRTAAGWKEVGYEGGQVAAPHPSPEEPQEYIPANWQERQFERRLELHSREQKKYYQEQLAQYQRRIERLEAERINLQAEKVRLETMLEQQGDLQNQILEQSQQNWQEFSRKQQQEQTQHVLQNLQPLQQQLQYFQRQLEHQHQDGIKNTIQLEEYLKHLQADTNRLSSDAQNLAKALKGDQKCQGAWGEMVLARTLEESGLREGVEYQLQKSFFSEDGSVFRPDAVVQFPGQRYIIIDSKVSLKAYDAFLAADDAEERKIQLRKHCESLAKHIKDLAAKEYQSLLGVQQSPDFVLLFCPIEGALAEAMRQDSYLFEEGFRRHVILVSPSLLFVVLRIVEQLWRYEKQRRNVAEVFAQAGKIFDKLALFCGDMGKVEQQANSLQKSVGQAMQRLSGGRQSLLRQVQKLQDLGADTNKELPVTWLEGEDSES